MRLILFLLFVLEVVFSTSITFGQNCPPHPICDTKANPSEILCKIGDPDKNGCQKFKCFPTDPGTYIFNLKKLVFKIPIYVLMDL